MNGTENETGGIEKRADGLPAQSGGALTRDRRGRAIATGLLTPMQKAFVKHMVSTGGQQLLSAKLAGFRAPATAGYHLMQLPHVQEALRLARVSAIESLAMRAPDVLRGVMDDPKAPAQARVTAAKIALELAGHTAKSLADGVNPAGEDLETYTVEQLEALVSRGTQALERYGRIRDVTPQSQRGGGTSP